MFRAKVAKHALVAVLNALENEKGFGYYTDYGITKEDGELVVYGEEVYLNEDRHKENSNDE